MTLADSIISDVRTSNIDEEKHLRIISLRSYNKFNYQANSLTIPYHHPPGVYDIVNNHPKRSQIGWIIYTGIAIKGISALMILVFGAKKQSI